MRGPYSTPITPLTGSLFHADPHLKTLTHRLIGHGVLTDERRHIGVERAEGLGARPFVLQGAQEVDDLADRAGQVARRGRLALVGHAAPTLPAQGSERPARAIAAEHVEIVD